MTTETEFIADQLLNGYFDEYMANDFSYNININCDLMTAQKLGNQSFFYLIKFYEEEEDTSYDNTKPYKIN